MAPRNNITSSNLAGQPIGISFRIALHPLKAYLLLIGLRTLSEGDMARAHLITELLQKAGRHER